jgi:hypothetical protein
VIVQLVLGDAEVVQGPGLSCAVAALAITLQRGLAVAGRVEQLDARKTELRIAAIYVLEKVTLDFPRDQPTVVEILAAFIREHASEPRFAPDVKAAVTVIGHRKPQWDRRPLDPKVPIDLGTADLKGAIFAKGLPAPKGWKNDNQGRLTPDGTGKDQLSTNASGESP